MGAASSDGEFSGHEITCLIDAVARLLGRGFLPAVQTPSLTSGYCPLSKLLRLLLVENER